ncbi:unnamed protein product [marine sediment metagenome]|uniref:Lcl C-terminal domain-containing protein n=1 Tax=marine sediment metagenome TaxID=412755 RepID=X0ZBI9_9ZZZZ
METGIIIASRGLPKTGQVTEYRAGDDGTYQGGWWRGRKIADNRERFIAKTIEGDKVVIDNATGLMWAADRFAAGCGDGDTDYWSDAILVGNALDFAGNTDWRLPNINELVSIINWNKYDPALDEPPFISTQSLNYWSSTVDKNDTCYALVINFRNGFISNEDKEEKVFLRCVRGGL